MSATLECTNLSKRYPGRTEFALGDERSGVDLEVRAGELFALLGPSGCGKTTTLRIVGGFVEPSSGVVRIAGEDVTELPPYRRPTNTVFQNYALFPHMSVGDNVGFGLAMARVPRRERSAKVAAALDLVGLGGRGDQRVAELSGGQAQRAALARAMVLDPAVLLLDEPLGALDLKLRRQMQDELVALRERTSTTFIHVTHDQEEACAIADRIAVMDRGRIVQVDAPADLYRRPRTAVVAAFIDAGTLFRGGARRDGDVAQVELAGLVVRGPRPQHVEAGAPLAALLPPHCVAVNDGEASASAVDAVVERVMFTGDAYDVRAQLEDGQPIRATLGPQRADQLGAALAPGRRARFSWDPADVVFVEDDADAEVPAPLAA
jgi:ABC-type Fe3+/spermidine/putrescine transport system ATPase subunit